MSCPRGVKRPISYKSCYSSTQILVSSHFQSPERTTMMKTLSLLLCLAVLQSVALGLNNHQHARMHAASRSHGHQSKSHERGPLPGVHSMTTMLADQHSPVLESHVNGRPVHTGVGPFFSGRPQLASSPRPDAGLVTTHGGHQPASSLLKRNTCPSGIIPCLFADVCCPIGTSCAVDDAGNPACCPIGAACTGVVNTPKISFIPVPVAAFASQHRPRRIFGMLLPLSRLGSALGRVKKDSPGTAVESTEVSSASEPASSLRIFGAGGKTTSGTTGMPRPLRLFSIPVIFSKHIMATVLPANKYQKDTAVLKGGDDTYSCGSPFCSAAAHSMANPLRYLIWALGNAIHLFGRTQARDMHLDDIPRDIYARDMREDGGVEESIDQAETLRLNESYCPQAKINISEKVGGYAAIIEERLNSSASRGPLIPFSSLLGGFMHPVQALSVLVSRHHFFGLNCLNERLMANNNISSNSLVSPHTSFDYAKNAREGLGLGSALMGIWKRFGG